MCRRFTSSTVKKIFPFLSPQQLKKLIQCGNTSCLRPLLAVAQQKDRALLQRHCHAAAKRSLEGSLEEGDVREAVAYLSIAIIASGDYNLIHEILKLIYLLTH